jgi:hypothetical protein
MNEPLDNLTSALAAVVLWLTWSSRLSTIDCVIRPVTLRSPFVIATRCADRRAMF